MRKIIGRILVAIGISCGLAWLLLFYYYIDTQPPQSDAAHTNELSNHGTTVYITNKQQIALWILSDGAIFISIFGALMLESARRRP